MSTYSKHFPCPIVVWYEEKPEFEHEKVVYRDLNALEPLQTFLAKLKGVSDSDGRIGQTYNYSFDAQRFCKKVFTQEATFDEDETVFWLDADTITQKDIPFGFLEGLVKSVPFAYLGRKKTYTETGFLGFNTKHPDFPKFRSRYQSAYTSGRIFGNTRAWHDCIAFDMAREGIAGNNLNTTTLQAMDHVFPHTVLGPYITHNKGPARKLKAYGGA